MKKLGVVLLAFVLLAAGGPSAQRAAGPDIRLILLIAVDQFRHDYLTRFRTDYTSGIRRLLTEGAVFTDANLEHYPTVTAVGHATMLSGALPSASGIIGNDWFDRELGANVTSVTDATVKPLGSPTGSTASPRRLLVSTVGDELKLAARGNTTTPRVFGVSLKDRSAILSTGRAADGAYWWDNKSGNFVTSTYYAAETPAWLTAFNDRKLADRHLGASWNALTAPATSLMKLRAERGTPFYEDIEASPYGNDLVFEFTRELLAREQLGRRNATDLLAVSFSANDGAGHDFGPDSPQVRDISIRTDRTIGRLLTQIDTTIGLQHTVIAFTSDHGVAPMPESLRDLRLPGGRTTSKALLGAIDQALVARYGAGKWLMATGLASAYLNYEQIDSLKLDREEVRRVAADAAAKIPRMARVYTRDQLLRGQVGNDRIAERVLRGFNAQRSGDVEMVLEPYWIRAEEGTTHGTPYNYDAHIPLILMGRGIRPGEYGAHVALNDLAPTVATLAGVEIPSGSVGRVLTEALRPVAAAPRARPAR